MSSQSERTRELLARRGGVRKEDLEERLSPGHVMVTLSPDVAGKPQAQLTLSFAVNLLARLYPVVQRLDVVLPTNSPLRATVPRWPGSTLEDHVTRFLGALQPDLEWVVTRSPTGSPNCHLAIGSSGLIGATIFLGADGWEARISSKGSMPTGERVNPVGAYAAACLGVAEVWKRLLHPHSVLFTGIPIVPLEGSLTFSSFSYRVGSGESNPDLPQSMDIDRLTMIGVGAGGGAAAYTLASLQKLVGTIKVVDPDEIIEPNLNRYVFADGQDASSKRSKADLVKRIIEERFNGVTVEGLPWAYERAKALLSPNDYECVVAAVHSRTARRHLQFETPKILWDAAAGEDGEFRIWRMVLGVTECMHCKHPLTGDDPEIAKARQLDQVLGLGPDFWLVKVRDNDAFSHEEAAWLTARIRQAAPDLRLPTAGQRFSDWEAENCGHLKLSEGDEEIPIPFAPVMAGVLLAGEIIKQHHFHEAVLDSYYWNTLMGQILTRTPPARRLPRPDCSFCHDSDYLAQYERRWGARPTR